MKRNLGKIFQWVKNNFTGYKGGGKTIGTATADMLFEERRLSGCHDDALVFVAIVRVLGYPAVMVETAGISWAEEFKKTHKGVYSGHVFVEVYLNGKWILIDPTSGQYIEDYDVYNPVIPITKPIEKTGFYVLFKGRDMWDYGIISHSQLLQEMEQFANNFNPKEITIPQYTIKQLPK